MLDKIRVKPRESDDIRVGAIRDRMSAQGYAAVSALAPEGAIYGSGPTFWRDPLADRTDDREQETEPGISPPDCPGELRGPLAMPLCYITIAHNRAIGSGCRNTSPPAA